MALKKVKTGDCIALMGDKYVIKTTRYGKSGTMVCLDKDRFQTIYFEPDHLEKMRRLKVSQLPKRLAEYTKNWRKG